MNTNNNKKHEESANQARTFNLTVLEGKNPCHKTYRNGEVGKARLTKDYKLHTFQYSNTSELYEVLKVCSQYQDVGIITGQHVEGLESGIVQRRNVQFSDKDNQLLVIDFDGYPLPDTIQNWTPEAIEHVIKIALPKEFRDVSYVAQWSSSSGIKRLTDGEMVKKGFNCHLFFISDTVVSCKDIKERLFHNHMDSKVEGERKPGIDGAMFQQVQICFISSKPDIDDTFVDILDDVEKCSHVEKTLDQVPVKLRSIDATNKAKQRLNKKVETQTGYKKMNNADAEILLSQLYELDVVRNINSNGTWNLLYLFRPLGNW